MVNASGHIEKQLSKLQTQTADISTQLETLVDSYLQVLSQASKRQLMLASYHVCTQIYPKSFLDLSLSQRNTLQKQLREVGDKIQLQLREKWEKAKQLSLQPADEDGLTVIRQLFLEAASAREQAHKLGTESSNSPGEMSGEMDTDIESTPPATVEQKTGEEQEISPAKAPQENLLAEIQTLISGEGIEIAPSGEPANQAETSGPMQPAQLMRRQILIEKAIRDVLKTSSEEANSIMHNADVIPEIPQTLLAAASETERLGHTPMKTPNLVRLSIKVLHPPESDSDKDQLDKLTQPSELDDQEDMDEVDESADDLDNDGWSQETEIAAAIIAAHDGIAEPEELSATDKSSERPVPRILQLNSLPDLVVIHLRLSEIEFAETNVAVWRSRIRQTMAQLKRVGHAYKDAQQQLAIAQAEDAWRASWTND